MTKRDEVNVIINTFELEELMPLRGSGAIKTGSPSHVIDRNPSKISGDVFASKFGSA